uniref:Uncharacterized protein n=1 Tax=Kalanchoe fedtschenkoi TaxID=63787 RepID=A0A7N0VE09_KALFE
MRRSSIFRTRDEIQHSHEFFCLAFMCLAITATLAIISALCGTRLRRKNKSPDPQPDTAQTASPPQGSSPPPDAAQAQPPKNLEFNSADRMSVDVQDPLPLPLPPPPARRQLSGSVSQSMRHKSSGGEAGSKLSCMSMKVGGRSLSMSMRWSRKDAAGQKMRAKLEKEESVWMKTIILGEKCKVADDEDDAVIFAERGVKVTAYHPKAPTSLPVSRTSSYIDPDAIPSRASNVLEKDFTNEN